MWPHRDSGQRALERKAHKERAQKEKSRWLRRVDPELRALDRDLRANERSSLRAAIKASQTVAEADRLGRQVRQLKRASDAIKEPAAALGVPLSSGPLHLAILEVYSTGDEGAQRAACEALFHYRNAALDDDVLSEFLRFMEKKWRSLLCSRCFCRFEPHQMRDRAWVTKAMKFYACRQCHSVSSTIEGIGKVVLTLDQSDHSYRFTGNQRFAVSTGGVLVNWLAHKEPFDFDEILIGEANYPDIEELVMKLRNDTDKKRRKRYGSIRVHLGPSLRLSQAKLNLLKDTFGRIQTMPGTLRR